jgi:hypothetical protein
VKRMAELIGTFLPQETESDPLVEMAAEYFRRCDRYDTLVCTSFYKDEPVPSTFAEWKAVMKNSCYVRDDLMSHYHITFSTFYTAVRSYAKRFRR